MLLLLLKNTFITNKFPKYSFGLTFRRNLNLKSEEDPRLRLDIEKLARVVARGRQVASKTLYGSEHKRSRSTSLWEGFKQNGWKCEVTRRKRKEKGVDQQLVADLTILVAEDHVGVGTAIILSGDGDVKPVILICLKKKWKCEVVMWEGSISHSLSELSSHYPHLLKIVRADQYIEEVSYTESKFCLSKMKDMLHLRSQAAVVLDSGDVNPYDKRWVKKMTVYLGWPFECCSYGSNNQHLLLVLVSCKNHENDKENAKEYFDVCLNKLKTKYGDKALSFVEHEQHEKRSSTATKEALLQCTNRFELLELEKKTGKENRIQSSLSEEEVGQPSHSDSSSSSSTLCAKSSKYTESETTFYDFDSRRSSLTSGFRSRESDWSLSRSTSKVSLASSGYEGFSTEGIERFQTVVGRVKRNSTPKCRNKGRCSRGLRCQFRHTEEELEFFKDRRKSTQCWRGKKCSKVECSYVHTPEEGFCCRCSKWGHLEGERCRR